MKYESETIDETVVTLDTYNSDLNLVIDGSKYSAEPLTKEGFAFMWAGARATHGVLKGKSCYEMKVIEHLDVSHLPADEPNPHVVRVGYSVDSSTMQLGEDPLSYGYGGTGKISTNCQFKNYGPPFEAGDCILAAVDMDSDPVKIGYAKNGKFIGWAYNVKKSELKNQALFPHVLTKNCSFEVNFGQRDTPYFVLPNEVKGFTFIGCLPLDQSVGGTRPPAKREDCEMIMMCGLPGAGKSVWAMDYSSKNPEKKYNILGTNNIIDKMKVMGLPRKRNYAGRWDVLIQMATKCLNSMFAIGSKLRRNYILDQTNVYPTAQRRKMRNFDGFKRIAVVVVPTEAEYKRRCDKRDREEGKEVPDSAVLEMKANFKLPEVCDIFNEVIFTELQREEAEKLVVTYNEEGKASVGPARKHFRRNEPDNKEFDNQRGNFGNYGRNDMSDSRGGRGGYGSFHDDQGMRGQSGFGGGRGSNRGGFNSGHGGGYGGRPGGGYGDPDSQVGGRDDFGGGRGGGRGSYDNGRVGGRGGYDGGRGGGRGGYDGSRGGGRGGYDGNRDSGRGGYDGNRGRGRGGYDNNRGGGRGGYDSDLGGGRGGYDNNRGGGRGGYDSDLGGERGSYDSNQGSGRGGYDGNRAGGRGGLENSRGGGRGGYDSNRGGGRGGYDSNRGGGRGGYDSNRGSGRGSYDSNRGSGRGGYDSNRGSGRGGYDSNRSGGRGGYGSNRGGGRGGYESNSGRGGYDSAGDSYGSARGDSYDNRGNAYGMSGTSGWEGTGSTYSSGYGSTGYDTASSGDMYGKDYESIPASTRRSGYGYSDYSSDNSRETSNQGYGDTSSRGSSGSRFQQSARGGSARGGARGASTSDSYSRDNYSAGYSTGVSTTAQSSYSDRSYGYGSEGYGGYKAPSADSYGAQSSYTSGSVDIKTEPTQRYGGSGMDSTSSYSQGSSGYTRSEGRPSRWSADTSQTTTAAAPADAYSSVGTTQSYAYPKSDQAAGTQAYGYQQAAPAAPAVNTAATQSWMGSSATVAATPAVAYGTMTQAQWMQYGQQYYTQ